MLNTLLTASVATGDRPINIIPFIAIGAAVLVLGVLLCLPMFKKKSDDGDDNDTDE